ncbi:outer membrane protein assembly factor BamA [Leptobacterium flavescens]|uniref:Outer membrane protein assembly factor BamA n=1 Tax=Leptobacterium flavescens TaxID=472055 RepID=A0A6P0UHU3_9FLAO|nr:outer membrane protein assembly factor BamA [Leptobacterium flavescens]NER12577.1 outer membrane protein assembly factor BamA [Leptobacterium flavescens]
MFGRYFSVLLLFIFCNYSIIAQETSFDKGKKYILGGIKVTGIKSYNENTVITYTRLRVGQPITVPGEEISKVIKNLWGLELFSDINVYITKIEGDKIFLELNIQELPTLSEVKIAGIKNKRVDEIVKETDLKKGKKLTESFLTNTKNYLVNKYKKQGYLNAKVNLVTAVDTAETNSLKLLVNIDRGEKVKVRSITFNGNEQLKGKRLRKAMKNTKKKFPLRFWKKSKFIDEDYQTDLSTIIDAYKEKGFRDARIISDTVAFNNESNTIDINIDVEEGRKYYFGNIDFIGNTAYTDEQLKSILGIDEGDTYNGVLLKERVADPTKPDALDVTNLYQNNGYLFSRINTVEVSAENDTIDFEVRIIEGKPAYINNVTVKGNDKTNDRVIYREMRVRPGQLYSKDNVIRTIRELGQLGFFDPEAITPDIQNPDPNAGTVDIEYSLVEKGSSQVELQGGFGGGGFIGTLGLSFSNFAIKDIFKKEAYKPIPTGDGQRLALRLQASRTFQTYSFSFSEPWLGGKKPVQFSISLSRTTQFRFDILSRDVDRDQRFIISGITLGLAKRLTVPDNFFTLSHALAFQNYDLRNFNTNLFTFPNGFSNNLSYTIALSRRELSRNPIYPTWGSEFSLSAKVTFPYSLFNGVDYADLENQPEFQLQDAQGRVIGADGRPISETGLDPIPDEGKIDQERFNWLEFYKIKFSGKWYTTIYDKLVLQTSGEFGFLGAYNNDRGLVPFERFFLGGDGLGNFTLDGRENIALRGYPNQSITTLNDDGTLSQDGQSIYNKFSLELRYPLTLKPAASIYGLAFLEGGAAFDNFRDFNPFRLNRSAGFGIRIFMPAFGLLGIDFGYGFDALPGRTGANGWETHFIIGQQF